MSKPAKIQEQFIVSVNSSWQILFVTDDGYFITSNGGFGQRDMYIVQIMEEEAHKLISKTKKEIK